MELIINEYGISQYVTSIRPVNNRPEQWRPTKYKNYYVSDIGRVINTFGGDHLVEGKIRTSRSPVIRIRLENEILEKTIKALVYETFVGEIPEGYVVATKNHCYYDNDVTNLRLISWSQNSSEFGGGYTKSRKVIDRKTGKIYKSCREASKYLYCSASLISKICNGKKTRLDIDVEFYIEKEREND